MTEPDLQSSAASRVPGLDAAVVVAVLAVLAQTLAYVGAVFFYRAYGLSPSDVGIAPLTAVTHLGTASIFTFGLFLITATAVYFILRDEPPATRWFRSHINRAIVAYVMFMVLLASFASYGWLAGITGRAGVELSVWNPVTWDLAPLVGTARWTKPDERPVIPGVPPGWQDRKVHFLGTNSGLSYLWDVETKRVLVIPSGQVQFITDP